ncbi:SUMO-activating enzyme subunit 1-like [Halichondria panicea]|uniref:SUMO-activating enzyme subunit 1-like n=1 Tax=Halichondria panicea TaxID=6063 RepID=UPI00312B980A
METLMEINQSSEAGLTADEAEQYDRQIRLWGLDAQKRLRSSTVLVVGLRGLGSEVVKNIVLAGVHAITILDHTPLSKDDFAERFLIRQDGENRALQAVAQLQMLNPNVLISADSERVEDKGEEFFTGFDVVCVTSCTTQSMVRIDEICRKNNIKFFCGDVWGYYGYCFTDLSSHDYTMEVVKDKMEDCIEVEAARSKRKSSNTEREMVTIKKCQLFCSLRDSLAVNWSNKPPRYFKRTPPTFFIIQTLQAFKDEYHRDPSCPSDSELLLSLREQVALKYGISKDLFEESFVRHCNSELSPVCAIVGGVLGQEIIKAISAKDIPYNNWFLYNGVNSTGIVETIQPST